MHNKALHPKHPDDEKHKQTHGSMGNSIHERERGIETEREGERNRERERKRVRERKRGREREKEREGKREY